MSTKTKATMSHWYFLIQHSGPRTVTVLEDQVAYEYLKHSDVKYLARVGVHQGQPVITELKVPLNYGEESMCHTECEQEVRRCIPEHATGTANIIEHVMQEQARLVRELWDNLTWDADLWETLSNRLDVANQCKEASNV